MYKIKRLFIFILFIFFNISYVFSQINLEITNSQKKAISIFNKTLYSQSRLFNGPYYQGYKTTEETPYFQDLTTFSNGSIVYDHYHFDNVPLIYDIYNDIVASLAPDGISMYSFINSKLLEFYLNEHHFIHLNELKTSEKRFPSGFFDLIYDGKLKVLVKRSKTALEKIRNSKIEKYYTLKLTYFLQKDMIYYSFTNESSFLKILKDKKTELKDYMKENQINFKDDPDKSIIILTKYYESLTK